MGAARGPWSAPVTQMKTYVATPENRQRDWYVVDAEGRTLGRLATQIADALRGKRKPEYTPHCDTGDFVVVVNAAKIKVTGNKLHDKLYYRHSGYPGGIALADPRRDARAPARGGDPQGGQGDASPQPARAPAAAKLKVYAGPEHPHEAQKPQRDGGRCLMADDERRDEQQPRAARSEARRRISAPRSSRPRSRHGRGGRPQAEAPEPRSRRPRPPPRPPG